MQKSSQNSVMHRYLSFLSLLLSAHCSTACAAQVEQPVIRDVVREAQSPSDQALAWSLFQQVQKSMIANLNGEVSSNCIARPESKETDFVIREVQSRTQRDIERIDFMVYQNGETDVELYVRSSDPSVGGLVLYVREHSSSCIAFDVQIRVSEEGGY